ncbi:MAG: CYTH domain-containing protein [Candidatus Marsarchaeota archaeon]|jgi:adenylate cyclase class 2|nr:CYTH domain-containing protein [Candidatus Marsarchaeota archaeon]
MKEIETKIIDFDEKSLRESLKNSGARYAGKVTQRRVVFDAMPDTTEKHEIFRIRTNGIITTLTWKFRDETIKGFDNTEELEVEVSDFDKTVDIISKLWNGIKPYHQENTFEKWDYKGVEIAIIQWPLVPPYLELEGKSEKQIRNVINELGIKGEVIGNIGLWYVFDRYGQHGKDAGDLHL